MKIEYLPDPYVQKFLGEFNDTKASVIVINHQKSKTIQEHLEVMEYDGYKFISDAGEYKTFLNVCMYIIYALISKNILKYIFCIFRWCHRHFCGNVILECICRYIRPMD